MGGQHIPLANPSLQALIGAGKGSWTSSPLSPLWGLPPPSF